MLKNIAILGATGAVGKEVISILKERKFPFENIYPLASAASLGTPIDFGDDDHIYAIDASTFDFRQADITISTAGSEVSKNMHEAITEAGSIMVDNTSLFRLDHDVPLIIPEINGHAIDLYRERNIIANPNCSTILLLMALFPVLKVYNILRANVSTYQSVSGAGAKAMDELFHQTSAIYNNKSLLDFQKIFSKQIAFNTIPFIGSPDDSGYTDEELKMHNETKKIISASNIEVTATCVRVPVFVGHGLSVSIECDGPVDIDIISDLIGNFTGVSLVNYNNKEGFVTPAECLEEDNVFVSRLRKDLHNPNIFHMWVVGNNVRKGAALNAVQICELLIDIN